MEPYLNLARLANAAGVLSAPMELCPDLALLADVAEIVAARPALLSSPLEVEVNASSGWNVKRKRLLRAKKVPKKVAPTLTLQPPGTGKKKELPMEVSSIIRDRRCTDVKLIMEKKLTMSDLSCNLARLSVPQSMILTDFLEQEERRNLENGGKIDVPVVEPCLRVTKLTFKKWMPFYALTSKEWNAVAHNENNGLEEDDLIQLWSFRTGGSLGFAVVKA